MLEISNFQAILDINQKINSIKDVKSILKDISHYAGVLLDAEGASILLRNPQTGDLHFEVAFGESSDVLRDLIIPRGKGIAGYAAENKEPVVVENVEKDERFYPEVDAVTKLKTRCLVAMPLINKGVTIGVIEVMNPAKGKFDEDDIVILKQFAEQAALAISNALLYKKSCDRAREMECLYQISNLTNSIYNKKDLFNKVIGLLGKIFQSERISIMLINEETGKLYIEAATGIPEDIVSKTENAIYYVEKISNLVLNEGKAIFSNDIERQGISKNKRFRYKSRGFISAPIKVQNIPIGVINISEPKKGVKYTDKMAKLLQTIANQVGQAYQAILSYQERIENEKLKKEIEVMKMIQNALLISNFRDYQNISIYAKMKSAEIVSGDFYDIYKLSPSRVGIVIGDVSGKGLPASLYMAVSRSVIKAYAYSIDRPDEMLKRANEILVDDSRVGMFVTLFYGIIDMEKSVLYYSNAGHNLQYIYRTSQNELIPLKSKGIPLGINRKEIYDYSEIKLESQDIIICLTDGVVDAINTAGEVFGLERVKKILKNYAATNAHTIVSSIFREVEEWSKNTPQWDDMTVVVVKKP
ncbi:MAG: SpoIIE family protein phosphatase [Brevinematia bacterium]